MGVYLGYTKGWVLAGTQAQLVAGVSQEFAALAHTHPGLETHFVGLFAADPEVQAWQASRMQA